MSEKHTIEQLQAMSDGELAELTARLRGWTVRKGFIYDENGKVPTDSSHRLLMLVGASSVAENWYWNPPADIAQAYGLLVWATNTYEIKFHIHVTKRKSMLDGGNVIVWTVPGSPRQKTLPADYMKADARAMCCAFVLGMQEVSNG